MNVRIPDFRIFNSIFTDLHLKKPGESTQYTYKKVSDLDIKQLPHSKHATRNTEKPVKKI
jgi:hypothetical protein